MVGGRGADRTGGVVCTELEHVATSHSCQHRIPRLSHWAAVGVGQWSLECAATDHVLRVDQSTLHHRTTTTQVRLEDLRICGLRPGAWSETQTILSSAAQAKHGNMCTVVVCGLQPSITSAQPTALPGT